MPAAKSKNYIINTDTNSFATATQIISFVAAQVATVTKTSIGLDQVDNTSDANKPVSTAQQAAINNAFTLIASKTSVDGATIATTNLTFSSGVTVATHTPTLVIYKYRSGTFGIAVASIFAPQLVSAATALANLVNHSNISAFLSGLMDDSGNVSVHVTTASVLASTFDVFVYGTVRP